MNKAFFIIVFVFMFCCEAKSQLNLVPNGSFEEYYHCPRNPGGYNIDVAKDWFMPTAGSPDYFNVCGTDGLGVPQNYEGYQYPRTGDAYGGYYAAFNNNGVSIGEYISVRFITPLEKDKTYILTYYLSLADSFYHKPYALQYVNNTGALLTKSSYTSSSAFIIPEIPQFVSDPSVFLDDSLGWQRLRWKYKAEGGEEYLTIGYFSNYNDIKARHPGTGANKTIAAYYYIDDVSLTEYEYPLPDMPNVVTPNGDHANDEFYFDLWEIKKFTMIIYNRWGVKLDELNMDNPTWKPKQELNDGVYYYIMNITSVEDTEHYKSGFIQLIR